MQVTHTNFLVQLRRWIHGLNPQPNEPVSMLTRCNRISFEMVPGSLPSSALIWWKDAPWAILAQIMLRSCNVKCECFAIGEYSYLECPSISDSSIHLHQLLCCEIHPTSLHCKQSFDISLNRTIVSFCSYFINIFWFFSKCMLLYSYKVSLRRSLRHVSFSAYAGCILLMILSYANILLRKETKT